MPNNVLIYPEAANGTLAPIAAELVGIGSQLASQLGAQLEAVVVAGDTAPLVSQLGQLGVKTVYTISGPAYASYQNDPYTAALAAAIQQAQPAVVLLGQSFQGRDLAPRLAFRLNAGIVMDCVDIKADGGKLAFEKTMYGGNARARMTVNTPLAMATIRPKVFEPAQASGGSAQAIPVSVPETPARARFVEHVKTESGGGVRLEDARIVISGGRGLGSADAFAQLEEFASVVNGAVGASRGAVDAGYQPTERQIGLSGKVVSPDVYIAVALSGAAQHMAGCSGSKNIVAINRDPDAAIFKNARFGVVGDWKQILPAFTAKVKELVGN